MTLFDRTKEAYEDAGIAAVVGMGSIAPPEVPNDDPDFLVNFPYEYPILAILPDDGLTGQIVSLVFTADGEGIVATTIVADDVLYDRLLDLQDRLDADEDE